MKKVKLLKQPNTKRRAIELSGLHGTFRIKNADFSVHYFSTFASPNRENPDEESYNDLLKELHPMRERVKASEIKSLNTLLQRDLDDTRIATELIPYLCGELTTTVGFFPPVLAVLIPQSFISGDNKNVAYPDSDPKANGDIACGDYWHFEALDKHGRLGVLRIYSSTEIIVLDGQHRANAFRYIAGEAPQSQIHQGFYENACKFPGLKAELPVTLIWFDKEKKNKRITPNDISRELFVAVNNSAKHVSRSRSILLDERDASALGVSTYYGYLAEKRSFNTSGLSLLSAAFDIDVNESMTGIPSTAITTPIHLYSITKHFFFALARYDDMNGRAINRAQTNKLRFEKLFGSAPYIQPITDRKVAEVISSEGKGTLREKVRNVYIPLLESILNDSPLSQIHFKALGAVEEWTRLGGTASHQETWNMILCGGEGLYNQISRDLRNPDAPPTSASALMYRKATQEIEDRVRKARIQIAIETEKSLKESQIKESYRLFCTVAAQTGILMAMSSYLNLPQIPAGEKGALNVRDKISKITLVEWVGFLSGFSDIYFKNLEAKSWVRFQRLFARLFMEPEIKLFKANPELSPEYEMMKECAARALQSRQDAGDEIDNAAVKKAIKDALRLVKSAFDALGRQLHIEKLSEEDYADLINDFVGRAGSSRDGGDSDEADEEVVASGFKI